MSPADPLACTNTAQGESPHCTHLGAMSLIPGAWTWWWTQNWQTWFYIILFLLMETKIEAFQQLFQLKKTFPRQRSYKMFLLPINYKSLWITNIFRAMIVVFFFLTTWCISVLLCCNTVKWALLERTKQSCWWFSGVISQPSLHSLRFFCSWWKSTKYPFSAINQSEFLHFVLLQMLLSLCIVLPLFAEDKLALPRDKSGLY